MNTPLSRQPGAPAPYQQIRDILRQEILNAMSPGERIPPERDLARRFSATRSTIGRAIAALVSEGLLVRQVGRGTFVVRVEEATTRVLNRTVGLMLSYLRGEFPAGIVRSVVNQLRGHGYRAVLSYSQDSTATEAGEIDRLTQDGLDGVIILPVALPGNESLHASLTRLGFPMVFVDRTLPSVDADCVGTDNFWGAYETTSRLIARGHRRIAHFTWLREWDSTAIRQRREGYEQALMDHGIEVDRELICPPSPFPDKESEFRHSLAYLRSGGRPVTAVLCLNDIFCLSTIAGCRSLGLRIPDDIELASFYDQGVWPSVTFTRIVQDQEEIGRRAVDLLLSRIAGEGPEGPQTILVRPEIDDGSADLT